MDVSKLYVGNLPYSVSEEELEQFFSNYGTVKSVRVIEGKGFGFVEMESVEEAEQIKNELNGKELKGRPMRINEARPPKPRPRRY